MRSGIISPIEFGSRSSPCRRGTVRRRHSPPWTGSGPTTEQVVGPKLDRRAEALFSIEMYTIYTVTTVAVSRE